MFERPLRYLAITLSLIVAAGFVFFALDDFGRASTNSQNRLAGYSATSPTPAGERERERRHGRGRELIDDANDVLLGPFAALTEDSDQRLGAPWRPDAARARALRVPARLLLALREGQGLTRRYR